MHAGHFLTLNTPLSYKVKLGYNEQILSHFIQLTTVKLVCNDHPRDPKFVAVVDKWSLFRGTSLL